MELIFSMSFALLYVYAGQVTWTNLALHAVLNGDNANLWQQAKTGQFAAMIVKAIFLSFWPVLVFATWIASHCGNGR